ARDADGGGLRLTRNDPETKYRAALPEVNAERLRWRPVAHVEVVRDDPRAGSELAEQLRPQAKVQLGRQVQRHHGGLAEVGLEQIARPERHAIGDAGPAGRLHALGHQLRIDLDADAPRAEVARRRDHHAAVARAQIVDDVARPDDGQA